MKSFVGKTKTESEITLRFFLLDVEFKLCVEPARIFF